MFNKNTRVHFFPFFFFIFIFKEVLRFVQGIFEENNAIAPVLLSTFVELKSGTTSD